MSGNNRNTVNTVRGDGYDQFRALKSFDGFEMQQPMSIGRRAGVAEVFGSQFSGFIACWMWRTIYLSKLPRFDKKFRVALDWTLDLLFHKDLDQFQTQRTKGVSPTRSRSRQNRRSPRDDIRSSFRGVPALLASMRMHWR